MVAATQCAVALSHPSPRSWLQLWDSAGSQAALGPPSAGFLHCFFVPQIRPVSQSLELLQLPPDAKSATHF